MMITKICLTCGKEFQVPHWRKDAKYCCQQCQRESLKGKPNCICEICGKHFHLKPYFLNKYKHHCCSKECINKWKSLYYLGEGNHQYGLKGELNASFGGVELIKKNNNLVDIKVYDPTHPYSDNTGRVLKHRLIVEQNYKLFDQKYFEKIGDRVVLKKTSQVHHLNEDHNDNRIENLIPVTRAEHRAIHNMNLTIVRDSANGRITGVIKQGELLEKPEVADQQPSTGLTTCEGSETNS